MTSTPEFAITTDQLTKRYNSGNAVDGLTLRVPTGSVFGFLGPNGAGKSTTIRILMGLTEKTSGEAHVLGFDCDARSSAMRKRVGYVPEFHRVYPWMRVREAIGFCRALYPSWNDALCRNVQSMFGLDEQRKVGALSKGMLAKLGLLIAVSHEPELLILDEPTSGLDPMVREEFMGEVLRRVCERTQTVLMSSHGMDDVQRLADRVGILFDGRLLVSATTGELLEGTKRLRAVIPEGAGHLHPPPGTIWQRLNGREWTLTVHGFSFDTLEYMRECCSVEHLDVFDLGLEDIFKDVVRGRREAG